MFLHVWQIVASLIIAFAFGFGIGRTFGEGRAWEKMDREERKRGETEERYIRYALSRKRYVELDLLTGQLQFEGKGLDEGSLTRDETWELTRFCVEHRNSIDECCGQMGELSLSDLAVLSVERRGE